MTEKFKVGQKVYCITYGVGEVVEIDQSSTFPVRVKIGKELLTYLYNGKLMNIAVNPNLLTLEEARAKGYDVPKQKIVKEKTVYINLYKDGSPHAHRSIESALRDSEICVGKGPSENLILRAYPVTIKYEVEE